MDWLSSITTWLIALVKAIWSDFTDFLNEFWILIAETVLTAIASTIVAIPAPAFLDSFSMASLLSHLPSSLLYFLAYLQLPEAFALIGMGFTFRMVRKLITLFQW